VIVQTEETMKFFKKTAGIVATSMLAASLFSLSAFADQRPQGETWRNNNDRSERRDDRNDRYDRNERNDRNDRRNRTATIAGRVERIDTRRDVIVLREARSGRAIVIDMDRVDNRSRRADLNDLRRGDFVRLTGEWDRDGFEAYRIDDVSRNRGGRRY
jgi:lysyl-tRNA synthetase class II